MSSKAKSIPLLLRDTLRDLALLRASDCDLASVLPPTFNKKQHTSQDRQEVNESVERSYEFVREARAAIKLLNRGEVEKQGGRVEDVRTKYLFSLQSRPQEVQTTPR